MHLLTIFLANPPQQSLLPTFLLFGGVLLVLYFTSILPQQRKQKQAVKFRESLKVGSDIITIGGLHGKIVAIDEKTFTLQVDKGFKLVFERYAVAVEATRQMNEKQAQQTKEKERETEKS